MRRRIFIATYGGVLTLGGCLGDTALDGGDDHQLPPSCPKSGSETEYRCGGADPISYSDEIGADELERAFSGRLDLACHDRGARRGIDYTRARLANESGLVSGKGGPGDALGANFEVYVGDHEAGPSDPVSFDEVLSIAPSYVETTVKFEDEVYECDVPVYVGAYDDLITDD